MPQVELINRSELNGDGIGYIEQYDFSKANMSHESRVNAITTIASVCYQNPKAINSESLYNRLAMENKGLPSSSYEFVPVLLSAEAVASILNTYFLPIEISSKELVTSDCEKYGQWISSKYLLTNLRALIADVGDKADQFYNTEEECKIIAKHFKVFKSKIDLATARQYMRHRCSWQELSRRYVSGKKSKFEFYISPKMDDIYPFIREDSKQLELKDVYKQQVQYYNQAIESGIKPEEARRLLPQAMYTTVWSAWQPKQLEVFFKLRLDSHAQVEIRELAEAKQTLVNISSPTL